MCNETDDHSKRGLGFLISLPFLTLSPLLPGMPGKNDSPDLLEDRMLDEKLAEIAGDVRFSGYIQLIERLDAAQASDSERKLPEDLLAQAQQAINDLKAADLPDDYKNALIQKLQRFA